MVVNNRYFTAAAWQSSYPLTQKTFMPINQLLFFTSSENYCKSISGQSFYFLASRLSNGALQRGFVVVVVLVVSYQIVSLKA